MMGVSKCGLSVIKAMTYGILHVPVGGVVIWDVEWVAQLCCHGGWRIADVCYNEQLQTHDI